MINETRKFHLTASLIIYETEGPIMVADSLFDPGTQLQYIQAKSNYCIQPLITVTHLLAKH